MKKLVSILLLISTLTLCLASCNNSSENNSNNSTNNNENTYVPPAKTAKEKAIELICSITDAESCYTAAKAFDALTQEEQNADGMFVHSYSLEKKMEEFSDDTRIRDYLMKFKAAEEFKKFHNETKNKLLNINSYTVNSQTTVVFYDDTANDYYLKIIVDYSAQNKLGGYTRNETHKFLVWENNRWILWQTDYEDLDLVVKMRDYQLPVHARYYFTYDGK